MKLLSINISPKNIEAFREKLGGRITYASPHPRNLTIEYDYIIWIVMNYYRALRKTNWDSAEQVRSHLQKHNLSNGRFSPYNNHIINRFYKIRIAINESKIEYEL